MNYAGDDRAQGSRVGESCRGPLVSPKEIRANVGRMMELGMEVKGILRNACEEVACACDKMTEAGGVRSVMRFSSCAGVFYELRRCMSPRRRTCGYRE